MDSIGKIPRHRSLGFMALFFLSTLGQAQSNKKEQYGPVLQKYRNAAALQELRQELRAVQQSLAAVDEVSSSSSQDLLLKEAQSGGLRIQIENLREEVQGHLQKFSSQDKSTAKEAFVKLDAQLKIWLDRFSKAWTYNSHLNMTLSARDSAKFIAGTIMLERLTKLADQQADQIEFPQTEALSPEVIEASKWVDLMKKDDPGLMTSDNLYNSYCILFILDTFPLGSSPGDGRIEPPNIVLPPLWQPQISNDPMRKLYGICQIHEPQFMKKRNDNPWLQMFPIQGQSNLDLGLGRKIDCDGVSQSFQSYLRADEENSKILEQLIAILDDYLADRISDAKFHELYDPLEKTYLTGLSQLAELYPEKNFERSHSLRVNWTVPLPSASSARFVPWVIDYGPNSWNGTWTASLGSQDWHLSGPTFDANRGVEYSVKASVHDVCIDRRSLSIFGFWGDSSCSAGSCLFNHPGSWLHAGD